MQWALFNLDGLFFLLRWGHFIFGIAWIGMLWYFNFVQGPFFAKADAATKTEATKGLVPKALFYFRYGAMGTFVTGWLIIALKFGQAGEAGSALFNSSWAATILTGAIMGSVMWFNVWFVIWPRQQKVIASANGEKVENLPALARRAFLASRTNTLLSVPLLFFMGAASHLAIRVDEGRVGLWLGIVIVIVGLLEANALLADKGATTKPIEKVSGVIHYGLLLSVLFYVVSELVLHH
ncbi:MAG: urate hydroxylase PuuD [Fibrobacteria bacterium]